ncbi:MAG: crossover junction endodeoxyribonuclease RuvC [Elusimicrobiota bacterium]
MKTVIGIDPGLEDTGWAVLSSEKNKIMLKDFGLIKTPHNMILSKRLKVIYEQLTKKIMEFNVDCAAIEEVFFINKIKTQSLTIHARGVILLALENLGIEYKEYNPKTIKQNITGNGNANKKQIQNVIRTLFSIKNTIYPDIADAIAIALVDIRMRSTGILL